MSRIRKTTILGAVFALSVAMVIGSAGPAAARGEYKIGALFATSGPASMLGLPEKNTVSMLAESINSQGGINGIPVKVVIYDTQADPSKTVTAAKKLIKKDNVDVIIGPTTSGATLAIIDVVQKAEVPLISCAASVRIIQQIGRASCRERV